MKKNLDFYPKKKKNKYSYYYYYLSKCNFIKVGMKNQIPKYKACSKKVEEKQQAHNTQKTKQTLKAKITQKDNHKTRK